MTLMNNQPVQELRRFKRYKIMDGVYLAFKPDLDILGQVKNLSMGGICFEYLGYYDHTKRNMVDIDVFTKEAIVQLKRPQCKIIYNMSVAVPPLFTETRRCGLQFSHLTIRQSVTLLSICKKYAIPSDPL